MSFLDVSSVQNMEISLYFIYIHNIEIRCFEMQLGIRNIQFMII